MITGELKNKVDKIWEIFWTGGITNPLEVIEQFNYLLFIKQLDEVETRKERDANILGIPYEGIFPADCQQYRWSKFKNLGDANEIYDLMMNGVFPFIKNLHPDGESAYSKYMGDAIFKIPTPALLTKVIDGIDGLNLEGDSKGDLYEYLLSKLESAGKNGQFRTPRHIIQMMVELVKPVPSDIICDPAMGSAGFLMEAQQYLRKNHQDLFLNAEQREHFNHEMFYGFDMDRTMLRIGAMNMLLHGVDDPNIEYKDSIDMYSILSSTTHRKTLIDNLVNEAMQYGIDGINVDFEQISLDCGEHYIEFIRELSIPCRANGIVLSVDNYVPTGYTNHYNRKEQGIVADYVIIMGYDEHYAGSAEAGSVASINFVEEGIKQTVEQVPANKIINAVPFYTRIWSTTGTDVSSQAVGMTMAQEYIKAHNIETVWDEETCQNYGEYMDGDTYNQVWLEDADSIKVKLNVMENYGIGGVAEWRLGFEKPEIWDVIGEYLDK